MTALSLLSFVLSQIATHLARCSGSIMTGARNIRPERVAMILFSFVTYETKTKKAIAVSQ